MIREEIKKELDRRGWSALKFANETGIRYPSISEYLANAVVYGDDKVCGNDRITSNDFKK